LPARAPQSHARGMAIAIHAGAARPDIKTMGALKRTLLAAKSIAFAKEGASVSEILPVKAVELLGEFPKQVQEYAISVGGVSVTAKQATAAKELLKFATAPAAVPVIRKKGMEPERE
jgi:molybdate transport system substrate-binding protein